MLSQLESEKKTESTMFVSLAPPHVPISVDLQMEGEIFKGKNGDGVMEGQQKRALLISFLLCFFPPLFLPCTKELCAQLSALPLFCV